MGDRYIITVICPDCEAEDSDVWYAPTCGFITHKCLVCGTEIDLEKYTGITYADASTLREMEAIVNGVKNY